MPGGGRCERGTWAFPSCGCGRTCAPSAPLTAATATNANAYTLRVINELHLTSGRNDTALRGTSSATRSVPPPSSNRILRNALEIAIRDPTAGLSVPVDDCPRKEDKSRRGFTTVYPPGRAPFDAADTRIHSDV